MDKSNNTNPSTGGVSKSKDKMKRGPRGPYKTRKPKTEETKLTTVSTSQSVKLHGLQLEIDSKYIEKIKEERQRKTEQEFRDLVLTKFNAHIEKVTRESRQSSEFPMNIDLPELLGEVTVKYARHPEDNVFVFLPGHEFALRTQVAVVSLMEWSTRRILNLEKQISDLKSNKVNFSETQSNENQLVKNEVQPTNEMGQIAHPA